MKQSDIDREICAIIQEVLCKLDTEEVIRETMIDHDIHPFSDQVTENQVHIAFNQIYQEVIHRLKEDYQFTN
jgi:ERCC4-related helicase